MRVWLINCYGPIPGEGWSDYRYTMLGEALARRGVFVTWWTANFSHHFKKFRSTAWKDIAVTPQFIIRLVPTLSYSKNISLRRIGYELLFGWRMYRRAVQESPPDCIIAVAPNFTNNPFAVRLSQRFKVPLILDFFDLYPELFTFAFPGVLRPIAPLVLAPLYWLRSYCFNQAEAATAVCNTYLEVVRKISPTLPLARSLTIFIGNDVEAFRAMSSNNPQEADQLAGQLGKAPDDIWAIYAGSLGDNYDIDTLLQAAVLLRKRSSRVKIVIAGEGPLRPHVMSFIDSQQPTHLLYIGKLDIEALVKVYKICDIGLSPYAVGSTVAMPTKVYDYLSAGLPIVNSLRGELEDLLRNQHIGIQYQSGNPTSLADALEYLASHEEQRRLMAQNSYNAAMQFDQQVQYDRFVEFLSRSWPTNKRSENLSLN